MSLNRRPVDRSRPMLEAYGTGLTTAEIQWAARGWGALRVFLKERSQPESSFAQQSDWQTAGQIWLSGLTEGGLYDVRFVNRAGRTWDVKLHLPRKVLPSGNTSWRCTAPVVDPAGRLYSVVCGDSDGYNVIRCSDDGGQTWQGIKTNGAAFHSRMYYHAGNLYGTTLAQWATSYLDRLFYIPAQVNYTGSVLLAFTDPMFNPDPTPEANGTRNRVQIYPWGFEPRGPYWVIGAAGGWVPAGGEQTMTAENCNNRIYYTQNNWQTRGTMIAPPTGGVYGKHVHSVCWNPVSQCYFISIGDYIRRNYLVSPDLQSWQQVADGFYRLTGLPSGASTAVTWCPDGSFLAGNDDIKYGHITRFRADGSWEIVLLMPEFFASMVWDIWAYDDGEVWATMRLDNPPAGQLGGVMVSQDWGRTWRTMFRAPVSSFTPANIGGCHETRRLHGDWVVIDQELGRVPEPAYAWRRLG